MEVADPASSVLTEMRTGSRELRRLGVRERFRGLLRPRRMELRKSGCAEQLKASRHERGSPRVWDVAPNALWVELRVKGGPAQGTLQQPGLAILRRPAFQ
jgi:hypothetical protein